MEKINLFGIITVRVSVDVADFDDIPEGLVSRYVAGESTSADDRYICTVGDSFEESLKNLVKHIETEFGDEGVTASWDYYEDFFEVEE